MSNRPKEMTPFASPDSIRQLLKLYEGMYKLHTDRNIGLTDTGGFQYAGTIENFGSELLAEANKLRMKKPPIDSIDICDEMKSYFDMKFVEGKSDCAGNFMYHDDTRYFKQNMVCCLLKKDVLIKDKQYSIKFEDISLTFSLCAESTSDPNVKRMAFFMTKTPPTLCVDSDEYPLTIDDGSGVDTIYYFPLNRMTYDILGIETDSDIYDIETEGSFEIDLNDCIDNNPYIWFCVDRFRVLPDLIIGNNTAASGDMLLIPGIDGHDIMHLYPSAEIPSGDTSEEGTWFIKAYGDFYYKKINGVVHLETGEITKIVYLYANEVNCDEPIIEHVVNCNNYNYKICPYIDLDWNIHVPKDGEYDYDPNYYKNKAYVWLPLDVFIVNEATQIIDDETVLIAAFDVKTDERTYIDYFEKDMNHWVSGIHIDYTTDYSEHGVDKVRGTIHDLGKYDGLPSYYSEWMPETHRAHMEMYTIRDSIINNKNIYNRQTAALLIDSGVPQTDMDDIADDLTVSITYEGDGLFEQTAESESSTNYLSNLGYNTATEFGYTNIPEYYNLAKFIYHGRGIFSLGFVNFDPDLEYGRVYAITNDGIVYENNAIVDNPKPERTLARICDIPYSYLQMTNIPKYAPTYALDQEYVRQSSSWDEDGWNRIWNLMGHRFVKYNNRFLFKATEDLDMIFDQTYLEETYPLYFNYNRTVDMSHPMNNDEFEFTPIQGGCSGYTIGTTFKTIIGGLVFNGEVTGIDGNDVTDITIENSQSNSQMNIGNITSREMVCKTTASDATGLKLLLTFTQSAWDSYHVMSTGIIDPLYALKFDDIGRIWIWKYTNSWSQYKLFIGEEIPDNYYDQHTIEAFNRKLRTMKDVLIYNEFIPESSSRWYPIWSPVSEHLENVIDYTVDIDTDISDILTEKFNHDETYYIPYYSTNSNPDKNMKEVHFTNVSDTFSMQANKKLFPQYNEENTFYAYTSISKLNIEYINGHQAAVHIYDPLLNTRNTYNEFSTIGIISDSKKITWNDVLDRSMLEAGVSIYNVYGYTFANDIKNIDNTRAQLETMSRVDLLNIIRDFDTDAEPIKVEGTVNQYTNEALIDYIIERYQYSRSDIKLRVHRGDAVDRIEQPTGGYVKLIDTHEATVRTEYGNKYNITPLFVFKLDRSIPDLNMFRMYDDDNNDISKYCLLYIKEHLYQFINTDWIEIR